MTRDEIMNMPAGKDMDVEIAVHVFGYTLLPPPAQPALQKPTEHGVESLYFVNHYSTDIKAAWDVAEKLQSKPLESYFEISMTPSIPWKGMTCWHCELGGPLAHGHTAPLAICRAALLAVMEA